MMNELQIFNHDEFGKVRVVEINNEPWLVGKDVAEALGYLNASKAIADHVDANDKLNNETLSSLGQRGGWLINESGFYSLVFSSKLPKAKEFKRWVTSEVLPAIRKHGGYLTPQKIEEVLADPDTIIKLATSLKEERAKRAEAENKLQETKVVCEYQAQQIAEFQPIKEYVDTILASEDMLTASQIAADYGLSAKALNKILFEEHLIHSVNGQWLLYAKQMNKGYTKSKTITVPREDGTTKVVLHTMWTQKGRLRIHELLSKRGIKANMDKEA